MREPDWHVRLWDMLASAEKIERYTQGMTKEHFASNDLVIDAVVRNIEIIGLASRHIPDEAKAELSEVAWTAIWGMRDRLAHEYAGLDLEIRWATVVEAIPTLITQLRPVVSRWGIAPRP